MNVQMRPFYFSELVVDPTDHNRLYKPGFTLTVSTDGGETFSGLFGAGFNFGAVHPDHHALWVNPANPHQLILGTDGGVYVSYDRAQTWRHVRSLPVSQFYHVSHDMEWPYNVYGGLQDNGSWKGPSRSPGGITSGATGRWSASGDGFWAFADPQDANTLYVEYQGGKLSRVNVATGESKSIKPYATRGRGEAALQLEHPDPPQPDRAGVPCTTAPSTCTARPTAASRGRPSPPTSPPTTRRRQRQEEIGRSVDRQLDRREQRDDLRHQRIAAELRR